MAMVYISNEHKELAERLARNPTGVAKKPVFSTYMNFMVFAAMVGYSAKQMKVLDSKNRGAEVSEQAFANAKMDGISFLLALDAEKSVDALRENRESACWSIIESYAEGGFPIIQQWLLDQPGDVDGVETILSRMSEVASERVKESTTSLEPDVDF